MCPFLCVCSKCAKFSPFQALFYKMFFHSTNTLYVMLLYHTTADKVNDFVLGRFMLVLGVLGVSRFFSVYLGGSWLFSVIRYTGPGVLGPRTTNATTFAATFRDDTYLMIGGTHPIHATCILL